MRKIVLALFITLFFSGCAQKIPTKTSDEYGLIAIPVNASTDCRNHFFYYYRLKSDTPQPAEITIYPAKAINFTFSEPLPAGKYIFSSFDVIANNTNNTSTSFNKRTVETSIPITVEPGKITLLHSIFEVKIKQADHNSYYSHHNFRSMDYKEREMYLAKLEKLQHSNEWEVR